MAGRVGKFRNSEDKNQLIKSFPHTSELILSNSK